MARINGIVCIQEGESANENVLLRLTETYSSIDNIYYMAKAVQTKGFFDNPIEFENGYEELSDTTNAWSADYVAYITENARYSKVCIPLSYFMDTTTETKPTKWYIPCYYVPNLLPSYDTTSINASPANTVEQVMTNSNRVFALMECTLTNATIANTATTIEAILANKWIVTSSVSSGLSADECYNGSTVCTYSLVLDTRRNSLRTANSIGTTTTVEINTTLNNCDIDSNQLNPTITNTYTLTPNSYYKFSNEDTPTISYTSTSGETVNSQFALDTYGNSASISVDGTTVDTEQPITVTANATRILVSINEADVSNCTYSPNYLNYGETVTFIVTANNNYDWSGSTPYVIYASSSTSERIQLSPNLSEDLKTASFSIDTSLIKNTNNTPSIDLYANATAIAVLSTLYTAYKVSISDLSTISSFRFGDNQLSNYINDVYLMPLDIDNTISQNLIINGITVIENSNAIISRKLVYDLGTNTCPLIFNNGKDQLNQYYAILPFYGRYQLETSVVCGKDVTITLQVDIISGETTYTFSINDVIIASVDTNIKIGVPYLTANEARISDFNKPNLFEPTNITIDVFQHPSTNIIYNNTTNYLKYENISDNEYFRGEIIDIKGVSKHYIDLINNELNKGVFKWAVIATLRKIL